MQVFCLDQLPGEVYPSINMQFPGQLLERTPRRSRADQHQVHILLQTLQRAQHHGVILHRRETCHGADNEGALRNAPVAAPSAAFLGGDVMEGALLQEIRQFNHTRRRHALRVNHKPCDHGAIDDHAVREPIAVTVEWQETRTRTRIQPAATGNDATTRQSRPRRRKDVGIQIVRVNNLNSFAPEQPQEAHPLSRRAR